MTAAIDQGFGITLAGASDALTGQLQSVNWNGVERTALPTTYAGTTGGKATFLASDIVDYGSWEASGLYQPDVEPDIDEAAETWTLTFPVASGQSTAVDIDASGIMTSFSAGLPHDGMMTFQNTIKISGDITLTAST